MNFEISRPLTPTVVLRARPIDTLSVMGRKSWGDHWKNVCAPILMARKKELGRRVPEREIAAAVEAATGKQSERSLVGMWLQGRREPYVSQFIALCEKLELDPAEVLFHGDRINAVRLRTRGRSISDAAAAQRKLLSKRARSGT